MSDDEAYQLLASKVRAAISKRKNELYAAIRLIETLDELNGYELVRASGNLFMSIRVGGSSIEATDEQKDAFRIRRNNSEWRGYIDEIKQLLEEEARS